MSSQTNVRTVRCVRYGGLRHALNRIPVERPQSKGDFQWRSGDGSQSIGDNMTVDRLVSILELLQVAEQKSDCSTALCLVAAALTSMDGAAVGLLSDGELTVFGSSNEIARRLLNEEATIGEGPCVTAATSNDSASLSELDANVETRWAIYAPLAIATGARAVFAFPVRIGAIRFGGLLLYRCAAGPLTLSQSSDGHLMASIAARAILALQAGAPRDTLSHDLERSATFDFVVQQAAGMVSEQGGIAVRDALVLLRAHGFAVNVTSNEIALQIVTRTLRYDRFTQKWIAGDGAMGQSDV